jgi:hypothetical protein
MPKRLPAVLAAAAFLAAVAILALAPALSAGPVEVTCGDMTATLCEADPGKTPSQER